MQLCSCISLYQLQIFFSQSIFILKMFHFRDFILFLKNPSSGIQFDIKSISSFLKLVWISFLILLGIDIITGLLIITPLRYFNLLPSRQEINLNAFNILKVTLLLPILEELIFRLPLRISKINLTISFSLIIFLVFNKWCFSNIYLALSFSVVLFLLLYIGIIEGSSFFNRLTTFFTEHFGRLFYFQAFVFGFLHLTNYTVDFRYFYLFPFFTINYIITGCLFGYLRVRFTYGIYLCIASHIVANCIYCFVLSR